MPKEFTSENPPFLAEGTMADTGKTSTSKPTTMEEALRYIATCFLTGPARKVVRAVDGAVPFRRQWPGRSQCVTVRRMEQSPDGQTFSAVDSSAPPPADDTFGPPNCGYCVDRRTTTSTGNTWSREWVEYRNLRAAIEKMATDPTVLVTAVRYGGDGNLWSGHRSEPSAEFDSLLTNYTDGQEATDEARDEYT